MNCFAGQWILKYSKAFKMHWAKNVKLILWLWWMYCWYFGGKTQKGYGKRYVYVFAESNQNKHMTPTLYDSTSFRYVSGVVSTNDAKNKNKFKVLQDSIWSQWISNRLSNFFADSFRAIWYWFSCKNIFVAISQYSIILLQDIDMPG